MGDEWMERRVADLEVGDEVRDYGTVTGIGPSARPYEAYFSFGTLLARYMLRSARVDVRRPVEVMLHEVLVPRSRSIYQVFVGDRYIAEFVSEVHATDHVLRLRGSATERAKALGQ